MHLEKRLFYLRNNDTQVGFHTGNGTTQEVIDLDNNIDTYNEALDAFCDIKQGILVRMAKSLQDQIPDKVYQAMMNTDVKSINAKHYEILE